MKKPLITGIAGIAIPLREVSDMRKVAMVLAGQ